MQRIILVAFVAFGVLGGLGGLTTAQQTATVVEATYEFIVTDYRSGRLVATQRVGKYVFDEAGNQTHERTLVSGETVVDTHLPAFNERYTVNVGARTAAVGPMNVRFGTPGLAAPPPQRRAPRRINASDIPRAAVRVTPLGNKDLGVVLVNGGRSTHDLGNGLTRVVETWVYEFPLDAGRRSPTLILESESTITDRAGNLVTQSAKRVTGIRRIAASATTFALQAGVEIVRDVFEELGLQRRR